jgi:hypothetical protein
MFLLMCNLQDILLGIEMLFKTKFPDLSDYYAIYAKTPSLFLRHETMTRTFSSLFVELQFLWISLKTSNTNPNFHRSLELLKEDFPFLVPSLSMVSDQYMEN